MMKLALGRIASLFSFSRQQRRGLSRRRSACRQQRSAEELESRIVLAAVNPLNVLVSDGAAIHEFTQGGTLVQSFQIPGEEALDQSDLIVGGNGIIHVYGNADSQDGSPLLSLDPVSGTWTSRIHSGWSRFTGDIAVSDDFVFVTAISSEPGQTAALVRFDTAQGTSVAFAPNPEGFRSVTVGDDGLLYASSFADSGRIIQVFDPQTLEPVGQVELPRFIDGVLASYRQIAVNSSGQIYTVDGDDLLRFDATGTLEEAIHVVSLAALNDIDLARNGHILLTTFDGDVIQLDETLTPEAITAFDAQARGVSVAFAATEIPETGEIRGVSFVDFDRDGDQDAEEPGIAGATVYLDLNNDGVFGPDEPSLTTGADGSYTFEDVAAGDYVVREVLPAGFQSTTRGNDAGFYYGVMFQPGSTDFRDLVRIDGATGQVDLIGELPVRLQGLVQTNSGELYGVSAFSNSLFRINPADATATLVGHSGLLPVYALAYNPVTDEIYGLTKPTNMDAQTYLAKFDRQTGAAETVGGPLYGLGNRFSVSAMTYDPVSDRFIVFDNSDDKFYAVRRDGSAELIADPSSFNTRGLATSARQFVFQNLGSFGNSQLNAIDFETGLVENIAVLDKTEILDALEWVGDRSLYRVSITPGRTAESISFGRWDPAASGTVSGTSFEDFDRDGIRDFNEPGIEGATVYLDLNNNGALDADEPATTTAANGAYTFENVAPGDYVVREVLPLGFHSTTRGNDPGTYYGVMFMNEQLTDPTDLVRIDGTTGVVERIGPLTRRIHGLVVTNSGEMYGISGFGPTSSLYRIDPDTAAITQTLDTGVLLAFTLAYDPVEDQIYGLSKPVDMHSETYLVRIDRTTGAATQVGGPILGLDRRGPVGGMTYDPVSDRFIVYDNFDAQFYEVSRDGSAKLLIDLPSNFSRVLATNSRDVVFQSLNANDNRNLSRIDLKSGLISPVLTLSEGEVMESLDWVGDRSLYRVRVAPYQTAGSINFGNERFNSPPTVTPTGPYVISEGDGVTLSATGTDPDGDPLSYAWDLDGDGEFDDAFGSDVEVSAGDLLAAGIADDGEYTISVQVEDGIFTVAAETTITVTNLAPQITSLVSEASTVGHASEGSTLVVEGSFLDPGVLDTHTATIDWGDGTTTDMTVGQGAGSGTLQASHAYTAGGSYEVLVTLTDDDGAFDEQTLTIFVTGARRQDGILQIVGTSADDEVSVNQTAGGTLMLHAPFLSDAGGLRLFGPADPIDTLVVWLGDGDDTFTLAANIDIPLIALGQAGDDQLKSGRGRDLLIGGTGADDLMGHMDEDILIGGSTAYDTDLASLLAIIDEWTATERSFSERMQNLTDGKGSPERLNGNVYLLPGSTVFDDGDADELDGGPGSDWVFFDVGDYEP